MNKLLSLIAGGLLAVTLAAPAAHSVPATFTGTLSIIVGTLPPIPVPGAGAGNSCGFCQTNDFAGGGFAVSLAVPVVNPTNGTFPAFPIVELGLTGPVALGTFTGSLGNNLPCGGNGFLPGLGVGVGACNGLAGNSLIGLFGPPPFAFLTVPLAVLGGGGVFTTMSPLGVNISAVGTGWTTGTGLVIGTTNPTTPTVASMTGFDNRTGNGSGGIQFVSPLLAVTNVAGNTNLGLFGVLTLNYVPEPGTLLLFVSGVAGAVILGSRRMRK